MKYAIVYDSRTGNTELLARAVKQDLPSADCVCFSTVEKAHGIALADLVFVGFWVDKGECSAKAAAFLQTLHHKKTALFGTCGFGASNAYFADRLAAAAHHLPDTARLIDGFMCQGKMPQTVKYRYEAALKEDPQDTQAADMLENFHAAEGHPDFDDIKAAIAFGAQTLKKAEA